MCRATLGQGISFCPAKSTAFHVSPHLWPYLVYKLTAQGMAIRMYTRKSLLAQIGFGLTYESKSVTKTWHHIRFETKDEIVWLRKLFGEYTGFGVEKKRPSKRSGYVSILHENDTCHVITPVDERSEFTSQSPVNMGVSLHRQEPNVTLGSVNIST